MLDTKGTWLRAQAPNTSPSKPTLVVNPYMLSLRVLWGGGSSDSTSYLLDIGRSLKSSEYAHVQHSEINLLEARRCLQTNCQMLQTFSS